jgi:hypothetical protein
MSNEKCEPAEADWYVELIYGKTFCPETEAGGVCTDRYDSHDRQYGTETSYNHGYFKGDRRNEVEVAALLPEGWYEIERSIKRCPEIGDETECVHCDMGMVFTNEHPRWQNAASGGDCPINGLDGHEPVDEFNA